MIRPGGRLIVIGYYGRDDVAPLLEPEVVGRMPARRRSAAPAGGCGTGSRSRSSTRARPRRPGVAHDLLPGSTASGPGLPDGAASAMLGLNLGLYHREKRPPPELRRSVANGPPCARPWTIPLRTGMRGYHRDPRPGSSPRSLAFGVPGPTAGAIIAARTHARRTAPMATTPRMKITYATLCADNEELQAAFEAAVERARATWPGLSDDHRLEERSAKRCSRTLADRPRPSSSPLPAGAAQDVRERSTPPARPFRHGADAVAGDGSRSCAAPPT